MKVKILHIIKTLQVGGAESNLLNLVSAMQDASFEFHVAYSYGGELEQKFRNAGFKLFKYSLREHKIKSVASLAIIYRLTRYLQDNNIDIVQSHTFNAHVWGLMAAKIVGCRVVEHVHDARYFDRMEYKRRGGFAGQFKYASLFKRRSDCVVVLTQQNVDFIRKAKLYPENKIRQIYNGIHVNWNRMNWSMSKSEFCRKHGIPEDSLLIFTPSRLSPEKNVEFIIRVAFEVAQVAPKVVFLIAGSGRLEGSMRDLIEEFQLQNHVLLMGYQKEIEGILSVVDIFLLPSLLELHSIAILEAMRQKIPVVVSQQVGCNEEFIVDGINGFLCDPFVTDRWTKVLVALLGDDSLRKKIGVAGFQTCKEKFSIDLVANQFKSLYRGLVGSDR